MNGTRFCFIVYMYYMHAAAIKPCFHLVPIEPGPVVC